MVYKYFPVTITSDGRKVPLISNWKQDATNDMTQLQRWQEMFRERLMYWGIPTGSTTGILALDIDVKGNGEQTLKDQRLSVPTTTSQRTLSGGRHFLFEYPTDGKRYGNRVGFQPGLDIRGEDGYIVSYGLDVTPPSPAPDWLKEFAHRNVEVYQGEAIGVSPSIAAESFERCLEEILDAPEGERNNTLNIQGFKVAQLVAAGAITEVQARQELEKAALSIGLTPHEIHHTLNSCFRGGHQKPLTSPFGAPDPIFGAPTIPQVTVPERWTPPYFSLFHLTDKTKLKKPQLFKDWSTQDLHLTIADGGTGKTTLKLYEAVCLALGERFLGFECINPGKTLFITGEDTSEKIGAMIGAIAKQMGVLDNQEKLNILLSSIVVKKDSDLCVITKDKAGFLRPSEPSMEKIMQAVEDIKPRMIVFDPISMFWGSEAALNDMALAVSRFMSTLVEKSGACVELINHIGKQSSNAKDMGQFAGRGGTGLPSHSRVNRVLRGVGEEEYTELTGRALDNNESAIMCNISKFSDGSPLLNKPFLVVRKGFLFERQTFEKAEVRQEEKETDDKKRVFDFIVSTRNEGKYPTKNVVIGHFMTHNNKMSEARTRRAIDMLSFIGHGTKKIKFVQGPDAESSEKVIVLTDQDGNEL